MLDKICELITKGTGKILHLPTYEIFYSIEQTLDGVVVTSTGQKRAKSWVRNAYNNLFSCMAWVNNTGSPFGAGSLSYINTAGTNQSYATCVYLIQVTSSIRRFNAGAGSVTGIVIGTGTGAFSFEDYTIPGLIPEGQGSGQVNYGQTVFGGSYATGSPTMSHSYLRYFNNNSGGDITLGNIGIIADSRLVCRDVLSPAETFYDKAQLKIQYTISLTFPY